jgi:hypothetical protein
MSGHIQVLWGLLRESVFLVLPVGVGLVGTPSAVTASQDPAIRANITFGRGAALSVSGRATWRGVPSLSCAKTRS